MKKYIAAIAGTLLLLATGCRKEASLEMNFPEKFEGKEVELITFEDSISVARATIENGKAQIVLPDSVELPVLTLLTIDGRTRAYYVAEEGHALLADSSRVASGTPLNEKFAHLMTRMDSVENLEDMQAYIDFSERLYNENRDTPFGNYFGLEWVMYADPEKVDSLLAGNRRLREAKRTQRYIQFAKLRKATAAGQKYSDFAGEDANGRPIKLSSYVTPGKYTLVDFWASWCPYCIKELPALKELYADMKDSGLQIVGVAVRDTPEDTRGAIEKHGINWPVVFNTGRVPYDIYGFSGIPHQILIGPDGTIIARGESVQQTRQRLEQLLRKCPSEDPR